MTATTTTNVSSLFELSSSITVINIQSELGEKDESLPERLHYINSAIVGPIICIPGMIANLVSFIVWIRPGMKSSTGRYLSGQAVADFFVLFLFVFNDSAQAWDEDLKTQRWYALVISHFAHPVRVWLNVCSLWITVSVTVDRYIMVCWITKAKLFCSAKRANIGLILVTINSFVISIPYFFWFMAVNSDGDENNDNATTSTLTVTEFAKGAGGHFYDFWVHCIMLILMPWITVLTLNVQIVRQISKSNKSMADKKSVEAVKKSRDSEMQITRMLLAVTFNFLFFTAQQCIAQCLDVGRPESSWYSVNCYIAFGKTGMLYNSALNFLFYCLNGKRFRNELKTMLGMRTEGH